MEIVHTACFDSPIGTLVIASTAEGLAHLGLPHGDGRGLAGWMQRFAPDARRQEGYAPNRDAIAQILEYLEGKRRDFELALDLRGTPFQRAVWREVSRIEYGATRSYAQIAAAIGRESALRAVGAANGANPLPLVVPCHRVIASGGDLGGYGGGRELKARLLAMERGRAESGTLL